MPRLIDLTGQTFGRLLVIEQNGYLRKEAAWRCRCQCGEETTVAGYSLRSSATRSCGCLRSEIASMLIPAAVAIAHANKIKPDGEISYRTAHHRIERAKGKAATHSCVDCGQQAQDWSLRHDAPVTYLGKNVTSICRYSGKPEDYEPRCRNCHAAYDQE